MTKVVIVDDDRHTRETLRDYLAAKGVSALIAESGAQAVDLVVDEHPDVVVLDVHMPGLNGFGTLARLRELPEGRDVPVLMMTAVYKDSQSRTEAMGPMLRATDYVHKPMPLSELWQRINQICKRDGAVLRQARRYSVDREVALHCASWAQFVTLYTGDISQGGVFVRTSTPPPLRSEVLLRLSLPGGAGFVELPGEVVHVVSPERAVTGGPAAGVGIQFRALDPGLRKALDAIVADVAGGKPPSSDQLKAFDAAALERTSASPTAIMPTVAPERARPEPLPRTTSSPTGARPSAGAPPPAASPAVEPPLCQDDRKRAAELTSELARLKELDYLAALGLDARADAAAVRRVFLELSKRFHPDVCRSSAAEVKDLQQEVYLVISKAYDELRKPGVLDRLRALADKRPAPTPPQPAKTEIAYPVTKLPPVEAQAPKPNPPSAQPTVRRTLPSGEWPSTKLEPQQPPSPVPGRARASVPPGRISTGEWPQMDPDTLYQFALAEMREGNHAVASAVLAHCQSRARDNTTYKVARYLCQGYLAEKMDRGEEAKRAFERAAELDPKCEEAVLALRRLSRPRGGTSLFGRILGKG